MTHTARSFALTLLAALLLAACDVPEAARKAMDPGAFPEERVAALAELRGTPHLDAAMKVLAERIAKKDDPDRLQAIALAGSLDSAGAPLVQVLLAELEKEDAAPGMGQALQIAEALSRIAPDDAKVYAAVEAKRPKDDEVFGAMWAVPLARFGELSKDVIVAWFESESGPTRFFAVRAMGDAGPWARPYLLRALGDPEFHVSNGAVEALVRSKAPASDVVPLLLPKLDAPDVSTRCAAADALARFGKESAAAAPRLRAMTKGPLPNEVLSASHALVRITGEGTPGGVDAARAALAAGTYPSQQKGAKALADFGPAAAPAVPDIAKLIRRTIRSVRAELCVALAAIGSKDGIPALVGVLRGELDPDVRLHDDKIVHFDDYEAALRALAKLGAKEALPEIRKLAEWKGESLRDRRVRRAAEDAMKALGG